MRCTTCGENVSPGQTRCTMCGAAVAVRSTHAARYIGVRQCPRCNFRGDGVSYFKRAGHLGLLVGLSIFTYGIGGLVYYGARRKHRVCPSCGLGWEHAAVPGSALAKVDPNEPSPVPPPLPPSGLGRRVIGAGVALFATLLITIGFVEFAPEAIAVGSVFGMAGSTTFWWGWKALQERRQALMQGLQRKVLQLAQAKGGVLTVTDVASEMNLSLPASEKLLDGMDDGLRVRSDITKEGVMYYEFPEVRYGNQLRAGDGDS